MALLVFDTEVYRNYYLIMLRDITGQRTTRYWEQYPGAGLDSDTLRVALAGNTLVGFNSARYDLPLLRLALISADCAAIKAASDDIIKHDLQPWQIAKKYGADDIEIDHIDIMEPTPGVQVGLKTYAGRIHAPCMQDLPIEPDAEIDPAQRRVLREYCNNDLDVTEQLYRTIEDRIALRIAMGGQYGQDLRSKSDAQIAETVIKTRVEASARAQVERPTIKAGTRYKYRRPGFIRFETPQLQATLAKIMSADYVVAENGSIDLPAEIADLKLTIGSSTYQLGIGGLHSTESSVAHKSDDTWTLIDNDVASYYPNIILRCSLYPEHMGRHFLDVYRGIVDRRLSAKSAMKTAKTPAEAAHHKTVQESLKIVLNGSYGKFGSKYSTLYSPNLMIQVTLTGQLALLMLIEALEENGHSVVSANTDGIVVRCRRDRIGDVRATVAMWEFFTCFEMEAVEYAALYSKDVNNYIAIKPDGSTKTKGLYAEAGLTKNPTGGIVTDAVIAYLTHGTPLRETVETCDDVRRFVTVRTVKGGGTWRGQYLGKTVRWYYGLHGDPILYKSNGNKVAKSDHAVPLMTLPTELPNDIDLGIYVGEANKVLKAIGATK